MTEFIEELPPRAVGGGSFGGGTKGEYEGFATECRDHRFMWAKWPSPSETVGARHQRMIRLKRGDYKDFRPPEHWEFAIRQHQIYARYVGEPI